MYYAKKLKRPPYPKELLLPFIILPAFILVMKMISFSAAYLFLMPFFVAVAIVNFLIFRNTNNRGHLVIIISMLLITLMSLYIGIYGKDVHNPYLAIIVVLLVMTFPLIGYLVFNKKIKWRKREMLELAAMKVEKKDSGYTDRPFPAGQIQYNQNELDEFLELLKSNMIALPIYDNNKVNLVINNDFSFILGFNNSFADKTWVSIDDEGNVLVHISKNDYLLYREDYSYDMICKSLGETIIKFFRFYQKGEWQRVIDQLNDLNLNVITEG